MSFESTLRELEELISPLFDDEESKDLTNIEATQIRGNLTYLLGLVNTVGLGERETAFEERKAEIDSRLKEAENLSTSAFDRLDEMLADPKRIRLPSKLGAVPKVRRSDEGRDVPAATRPSRADLTLPLIPERPGDTLGVQARADSPIFPTREEMSETVVERPEEKRDAVCMDDSVLHGIVSQLRNEFEKLYRQANGPGNQSMVGASAPMGAPEIVGAPKKNEIPPVVVRPTIDLRLDRVSVPTFSGVISEWIAFRDQFTDLVHENPNLTEIVKFYQLRSCLSGKALEVINGFQLSATDYQVAWEALRQRFDNRPQIIGEYIKRVLHLPVLDRNPTREKLLNMVDRTNQMLRVLPQFGLEVNHWGAILMVVLQEKLDSATERKLVGTGKAARRCSIFRIFGIY